MQARMIGLSLAFLHLVGVVLMVFCINRSPDPQAPMLWAVFAIIDFPISLIYFLAPVLHDTLPQGVHESWVGQVLYLPYLVHGILGTIWWYLLPRLFMPRRLGGVW